jgi:hypothetical protein
MKLKRVGERVLGSVCRILVVLLVPAMMFPGESWAQETVPPTNTIFAPDQDEKAATFDINRVEVYPGSHRSDGVMVYVHFHLNRDIGSSMLIRSALRLESGMRTRGDTGFTRELSCTVDCDPNQVPMKSGDWIASFLVLEDKHVKPGGHPLTGTLEVTGEPGSHAEFQGGIDLTKASVSENKWPRIWQVPALGLALLVWFPYVLSYGAYCAITHKDCEF